MDTDPQKAIIEAVESSENTTQVGMLTIKSANNALLDASRRPDPDQLFHSLWYEGEVGCLFSDSNLGKSIFAVQIAEYIAEERPVLYLDCELSEKQFQLRYTDRDTNTLHRFPPKFYRAEINPSAIQAKDYEAQILKNIETAMLQTGCKIGIVDNIGYLCNSTDKGVDAGQFMMNLLSLKRQYGWSLLIIAHTPKRSLSSPITQNDLAGSKRLFNYFDSVMAIGLSAKDDRLRYVKQLKIRSGEQEYGGNNVIVYEISNEGGFVHFQFVGFAAEVEHLRDRTDEAREVEKGNVKELRDKGKSLRDIAAILGMSKSKVDRILKEISTVPSHGETGQAGQTGQMPSLFDAANGNGSNDNEADQPIDLFLDEI